MARLALAGDGLSGRDPHDSSVIAFCFADIRQICIRVLRASCKFPIARPLQHVFRGQPTEIFGGEAFRPR
jgi:hypothetical protein